MISEAKKYHQNLAYYFLNKPLYSKGLNNVTLNTRKLVEQPWQQTKSEMWDELEVTLIDLDFFLELREHGQSTLNYWRSLPERFDPTYSYLKAWQEHCINTSQGIRELKIASHLGNFFLSFQVMSAEPFLNEAAKIADEILSDTNLEVNVRLDKVILESYSTLARFLVDTSRIVEAEAAFRKTLAMAERYFSGDQRTIALFLTDLAWLLVRTKRIVEAEPLICRAISSLDDTHQGLSIELARSLSVLGQLQLRKDNFIDAELSMTKALSIIEKVLGHHHPNVADCLSNLGGLFHAIGKLPEAECAFRRALQIMEAFGDSRAVPLAAVLNNLAQVLQDLNRYSEAEPLSRRQVEILHRWGSKTGHDHPYLEGSVSNYTGILQQMDYSDEMIKKRLGEIFYSTTPLFYEGRLVRENN